MEIVTQENQVQGLETTQINLKEPLDLRSILQDLDEIRIHQHLDAVEVCMGWERNNRYSLYNKEDQQILYAYEVAQCYTRQCYGSLREFSLVVTDNDDNRLLRLHRPLRCSSRCFYACCHLQEMDVSLPSDEKVSKVLERWSCSVPEYEIEDGDGNLQYKIIGSCCHCRCCCGISFQVYNSNDECCAWIKKDWGGCKELIGACNDYTVYYSMDLPSSDKSAILGAAFLVDFNYFQRHGKCF